MSKGLSAIIFTVTILLISACNGNDNKTGSTSAADAVPAFISYSVIKEYPHDTTAFTEGLQYVDGILYESTGNYGASDVRKTDLNTGKVLNKTKMEDRYFGEGLTVLNDKIYQLTYKEHTGFVYNKATLKPEKTFKFDAAEGWGLTNDGHYLIFDDGSNTLHFLDTATFKEIKHLQVTDEQGPVNNINELEYIKGFIYANQWQTDNILKIDPATGHVVGMASLNDLRQNAGIAAPTGREHGPDVLNGIAFDAKNNRIFITGKNWPKLFEIKLDN